MIDWTDINICHVNYMDAIFGVLFMRVLSRGRSKGLKDHSHYQKDNNEFKDATLESTR